MQSKLRLIDTGWDRELEGALGADHSSVRIVCPFIKKQAAKRLLGWGPPDQFQVITRFNLGDFGDGVSDISALQLLRENGAKVRGVRNLHAKLYLFGKSRAIVTSANLTERALLRNHELGFVTEDSGIVGECLQYFDELWKRAGPDVSAERLIEWDRKVTKFLASGVRVTARNILGDEGVDADIPPEPIISSPWVVDAREAFVKFFGQSHNRADRTMPVVNEVQRSGSHWACTYPKGKRPRSVNDGAVMFMGRMVRQPNDILIYGRAIGLKHVPGRDDATRTDLARRHWKEKWPHYVRVHHPDFVAGSLSNGVSLGELMDVLKSNAFAPTQRNAAAGTGNVDPRRAFMRQPAVQLSSEATAWLTARLESAYLEHGKLPAAELEALDWPDVSDSIVG
jgi:hypothetical protein